MCIRDSLEHGENLADRARKLNYPDIEHEFWHNGYDNFIRDMVDNSSKNQIHSVTKGDAAQETKQLIKAAIKQAGGKPAFAPVSYTHLDVYKRQGTGETITPPLKTTIRSAEAELQIYEIQNLAEAVSELSELSAAAQIPLRFFMQICIGDEQTKPSNEHIEKINAVLMLSLIHI